MISHVADWSPLTLLYTTQALWVTLSIISTCTAAYTHNQVMQNLIHSEQDSQGAITSDNIVNSHLYNKSKQTVNDSNMDTSVIRNFLDTSLIRNSLDTSAISNSPYLSRKTRGISTRRSRVVRSEGDCRATLLPEMEVCTSAFLQHYSVYRNSSHYEQRRRLPSLCTSYAQTLQCLHLTFLACPPATVHLSFMEKRLPHPDRLRALCFSPKSRIESPEESTTDVRAGHVDNSSGTQGYTINPTLNSINSINKDTTDQHHHSHNKHNRLKKSTGLPGTLAGLHDNGLPVTPQPKNQQDPVYELGDSLRVKVHLPDHHGDSHNKLEESSHRNSTQDIYSVGDTEKTTQGSDCSSSTACDSQDAGVVYEASSAGLRAEHSYSLVVVLLYIASYLCVK